VSKHLKYLSYVARHKWFVYQEARRLGVGWLGAIHDLSKFRPDEWRPYAEHFYGKGRVNPRGTTGYYKPTDTGDAAFDYAWLLHQKRNKHHWQWWCLPEDDGGIKVLEMPPRYLREMLADWRGAGMAQGRPYTWEWYEKNKSRIQLAPLGREWVERELLIQEHCMRMRYTT
jgi:hypothetical protein